MERAATNRTGEDRGKLREVRPHRGLDAQGVVVCREPDPDASVRRLRVADSRRRMLYGEDPLLDGGVSTRLLEVEAHAPDPDAPLREGAADRHPLQNPQIPGRPSSGGEGEGGERAAPEDREDRGEGGVVPREGEELPAERRQIETAATGRQIDPRDRRLGRNRDLGEKLRGLRGEARERDLRPSFTGVEGPFDADAIDLESPSALSPERDGLRGDPDVGMKPVARPRRDADAQPQAFDGGESPSSAGNDEPLPVHVDGHPRHLGDDPGEERREALQRIRKRGRRVLFRRFGKLDRQVRPVHPDARRAEPAPEEREDYRRDAHGTDGAAHLPRDGHVQLMNRRPGAREDGEVYSSDGHRAAESRGSGGLDPLPDRLEIDPEGGEGGAGEAEDQDARGRHESLPAHRRRLRRRAALCQASTRCSARSAWRCRRRCRGDGNGLS